jgi:predicted AlkP superfamily pyrophosphatase or phosphodiesterase
MKWSVLVCFWFLLFSGYDLFSQKKSEADNMSRPALVVGIVVDQMRTEYLYRFYRHFGNDGFKRLMNDGFQVREMHYNFVPTYTAPGHASVYAGTTPRYHGIVGNNWYSREEGGEVYCAYDEQSNTVGSTTDKGKYSPHQLLSTTITDELRVFSLFKSKTIGISIKDRGAIFPAGRSAYASYWFDNKEGKFVTSTYYTDQLPDWVEDFNSLGKADQYLEEKWTTVLPIEAYIESTADAVDFEETTGEQKESVFPYDLKKLREKDNYKLIPETPFGNSIVTDMALAALKGEQLGKGDFTDFLAISYSSTDYIGHTKGTHSIEIQDTYLRLDIELARLFKLLDTEIGEHNYLVFLTADHAGATTPGFAKSEALVYGGSPVNDWVAGLKKMLNDEYGNEDIFLYHINQQIYLNHKEIKAAKHDLSEIRRKVADYLFEQDLITEVYTFDDIMSHEYALGNGRFVDMGFHSKRSGDVSYIMQPGTVSGEYFDNKGTTHGSSYTYDTHVPCLWFGWNIPKGETYERYEIVDVAATLAQLLKIPLPNACIGEPIEELFDD